MRWLLLFAVLVANPVSAAEKELSDGETGPDAERVVARAMQAEIDGDAALRRTLLGVALKRDPDHAPARWQAGFVRDEDRWLKVEEFEKKNADAETVEEYRKLRDQYSGTLPGQVSLARWCRKNGLQDQEQLHWWSVLRFNPGHKEARRQLGVREFRGRLLTVDQIEDWKRGMRQYNEALDRWDSKLTRWRKEIQNASTPQSAAAWNQLSELDDADAVPSLERIFPTSDANFRQLIVAALGNIEDQLATDALVRLSLFADDSAIRYAAAKQLSDRSWYGFVPNLVMRLETPVEYQYVMQTLGDGVVSQVRFSKETPSRL